MRDTQLGWFDTTLGINAADLSEGHSFVGRNAGWLAEPILAEDGQWLALSPPHRDDVVFSVTRSGAWLHAVNLDSQAEVGVFATMAEALQGCLLDAGRDVVA
ncbi:hypothetical protein IBL26_08255 [Roseomonas aerophila]|uniref:Uncharacterized protein n=1 Tax=Teichococcus aerophilus TaxID=1224513 RepID=A0ABR7RJS0_9PROT|nr:hypothetical protein [Pseudoroseomonas aerophila]MBC9206826.1 hypothetical protein [Pseudoroseomonas aerophila]